MAKKKTQTEPSGPRRLSTGCTLLNLACSDCPDWGLVGGNYYLIVGGSDTGKSILALSLLAEAANNPEFSNYRLIYDGPENGALLDLKKFFGSKLQEKLEPPARDAHGGLNSETVEDFYAFLDDAHTDESGKPFVYVLDSMDCLSSAAEVKKFKQQKTARRKAPGEETTGSFGDGKAKANSSGLRRQMGPLARSGSILVVVNQERDKVGSMGPGDNVTHSGGRALKFYAQLQLWLTPKASIRKKVKDKDRELGIQTKVRVRKNRQTGRKSAVDLFIHWSTQPPIDNTGTCVNWLIEEGHWDKNDGGRVTAPEFDFTGFQENLIQKIENEDREGELYALTAQVWNDIREACSVKRKPRYE